MLTARFIAPTLRNGELAITIASSVVFTAGFYIPLNQVMGTATKGICSSYAQYIMPLIALQAITFAAFSTAFRAATDSVQGINRRFRSMPIAPFTPVAARISAAVYRCVVSLTVAVICGYVIGFRFHRSAVYIVAFCVLVLVIGALLSFAADLIGTGTRNPEAMTPLLILPPLIFGLLSVGVQPVQQFPALDPAHCSQPADFPVCGRVACLGRGRRAVQRIGDLVRHSADAGVAMRIGRGPGTGVGNRLVQAGMMTITQRAKPRISVWTGGTTRIQRGCWFRKPWCRHSGYFSGGHATSRR